MEGTHGCLSFFILKIAEVQGIWHTSLETYMHRIKIVDIVWEYLQNNGQLAVDSIDTTESLQENDRLDAECHNVWTT